MDTALIILRRIFQNIPIVENWMHLVMSTVEPLTDVLPEEIVRKGGRLWELWDCINRWVCNRQDGKKVTACEKAAKATVCEKAAKKRPCKQAAKQRPCAKRQRKRPCAKRQRKSGHANRQQNSDRVRKGSESNRVRKGSEKATACECAARAAMYGNAVKATVCKKSAIFFFFEMGWEICAGGLCGRFVYMNAFGYIERVWCEKLQCVLPSC